MVFTFNKASTWADVEKDLWLRWNSGIAGKMVVFHWLQEGQSIIITLGFLRANIL